MGENYKPICTSFKNMLMQHTWNKFHHALSQHENEFIADEVIAELVFSAH
jgi:hypothetical protein